MKSKRQAYRDLANAADRFKKTWESGVDLHVDVDGDPLGECIQALREAIKEVGKPEPEVPEPSPLPWSVYRECESWAIKDANNVFVCDTEGEFVEPYEKVNAELIVRAVNSHAALVEACEETLDLLGCNCPKGGHGDPPTCTMGKVENALKLAKEGK